MRPTLERVLDDFGRRIAELRRERGWTQAQAAERLDALLRDYQAIEGGERNLTMSTVVEVARLFGVSVPALFQAPESGERRRPGRPPSPPLRANPATRPKKRR